MDEPTPISNLAHMIQLSVAPVFLLLAIGSMLAVVTNRLGRVIDRGHFLERSFLDQTLTEGAKPPTLITSSVRVSMEKVDDHWLISGFDPV